MILQIAAILVMLSVIIILHELGHFVAARIFHVKIEEFGLGYPPLAKKLFKWQGTLFSLNWIPFGGFVKLAGELGEESELKTKIVKPVAPNQEGPFYSKSAVARLIIILAGAITNLCLGLLAFALVFSVNGIPIQEARISEVAANSPAAQAGIPVGVSITALEFDQQTFAVTTASEVISLVSQHRGQTVTIVTTGPCQRLTCASENHQYTLKIRTDEETPANEGAIGLVFNTVLFFPWYEMIWRSVWHGLIQTLSLAGLTLMALGDMIGSFILHQTVPADVTGPVGIVYQTYKLDIMKSGIWSILNYAGLISVSLGIMNILPIPALDGGRAFFIIVEKIVGKKHSRKWENYVTNGGYILLLSLIILITIKDIISIFKG